MLCDETTCGQYDDERFNTVHQRERRNKLLLMESPRPNVILVPNVLQSIFALNDCSMLFGRGCETTSCPLQLRLADDF